MYWLACIFGLLFAGPAMAHGFGQIYNLPVPVWLYLYGASAALAVSFLIVGFFVTARSVELNERRYPLGRFAAFRALLHPATIGAARVVTVSLLALTILTGLFGVESAYANFSMTLFWVVFVLGYTYSIGLVGNTYAALNPWLTLCDWIARLFPRAFEPRLRWPSALGYWPALILFMAFIWFELFGRSRPFSLGMVLLAYTVLNLGGAALLGRAVWFRHVEFFSVMFDLLGRMAPLTVSRDTATQRPELQLRQPFIGLTTEKASHVSLLLFVLFMLSATAFDGIKSTLPWVRIYWELGAGWFEPWLPTNTIERLRLLKAIYPYWQAAALILGPFLYLLVYLLFIWLTKLISRSELGVRELALRFALSLVPIAFVYHLTHYYTLLLTQGMQIIPLLSDPFGYGWNLFGTADWNLRYLPQAGTIWHTQVWLILAGHIVSVYLAHVEALKLFGDNRRAALSQLPMLVLMVAFTTVGLWILSLPIKPAGP